MVLNYFKECISDPVALLGLAASILTLCSMCFNGLSTKGTILMRIFNLSGAAAYLVYSILIGYVGFGMTILNSALIIINIYYLIKCIIKYKRGN